MIQRENDDYSMACTEGGSKGRRCEGAKRKVGIRTTEFVNFRK